MPSPARRDELERWIAASQRMQRVLRVVVGACFAVAVGVWLWNRAIGGVALAVVAVVALCAFWVTASHIADWRNRLAALDVTAPPIGSRRWSR